MREKEISSDGLKFEDLRKRYGTGRSYTISGSGKNRVTDVYKRQYYSSQGLFCCCKECRVAAGNKFKKDRRIYGANCSTCSLL